MFTFEVRINGTLIAHIYGRNVCDCATSKALVELPLSHKCAYEYEYFEVSSGEVIKGSVKHNREHKIVKLMQTVLKDVEKKVG